MDVPNEFMVAAQGANILVMSPPRGPINRSDALLFAAWIVALADGDLDGASFKKYLDAVLST